MVLKDQFHRIRVQYFTVRQVSNIQTIVKMMINADGDDNDFDGNDMVMNLGGSM